MSTRNLNMLLPGGQPEPGEIGRWATVTQISPSLRIRLDGETTPLPFTPPKLSHVPSLAVNDRVLILWLTNNNKAHLSKRLVIVGKA